jgi:protocatechuate 3,4-dioxygenase beta subunit
VNVRHPIVTLVAALAAVSALFAQPAHEDDPPESSLSWQARIAPASEAGEPMVVSGHVFDPDGRHPVAGIVVYAYQTDSKGLYTPAGGAPRPARLRGWARTDATGRYEFRTIRPGPYPGGGVPAHIHFHLWGAGYPRQWAEELRFEGGPYVTTEMAEQSRKAGRFGGVRPVVRGEDGTWRCRFDMRVKREPNF